MARDFSKNTSNYMTLGTNTLGPLLNGAAAISVHCFFLFDTLDTTDADVGNRILSVIINGASTNGVTLNVNGVAGANKLRARGRSVSTDGVQVTQGTTVLSAGTLYSGGGVWDIGGDTIRVYLNGAQEVSTGVTFGNATYTNGTPSVADVIGGADIPASSIVFQFDGLLAELAIWAGDIGTDGFYQLHKRASAFLVRPDLLLNYWPLWGKASPEIDLVNSKNGTITGTVAQRDPHPRIYMPRRWRGARRAPKGAPGLYVPRQMMRVPGYHPIYAG